MRSGFRVGVPARVPARAAGSGCGLRLRAKAAGSGCGLGLRRGLRGEHAADVVVHARLVGSADLERRAVCGPQQACDGGAASCGAAGRDVRDYLSVVPVAGGCAHAASASAGAPSASCNVPRLKYASALDGARASCGARGADERAARGREEGGARAAVRAARAPSGCRRGAPPHVGRQSAASRRGRSAFPHRKGATGARSQRCARPLRGLLRGTAAPGRARTTRRQTPDAGGWCVRSSPRRRRACHRFEARGRSAPARRDRRGQHMGTRCELSPCVRSLFRASAVLARVLDLDSLCEYNSTRMLI